MDRGIGSWVTRRAALDGGRCAFVEGATEVTWAGFDAATNRLGHALVDLGVRRGDRVGLLLANSLAFMEGVFAAAKLGAIVVPVNFRLHGSEVAYILADAGVDVFVYHRHLAGIAGVALDGRGVRVRHGVVVDSAAGLDPVGTHPDAAAGHAHDGRRHELLWADLLGGDDDGPLDMDVEPRDPHAIMYTSGTTGRPKGAVLTHANAIANARNGLTQGRGVHPGDVTVTAAPLFHIGGLGVHSLPMVYVGGTNVIVPTFDPPSFLAAMAEHRATVQFLVPAMWAALTRVPDFDSYDLGALEMAVSGGAPTPIPVIEFFQARGVTFQEGFGMTETAPSVSVLDAARVKDKAGSIGRPLQDVETRVVDETDRDVEPGTVGELVVRGDNVFAGYWMLPEATAEAFRGGWFHTGDLARVDDEGYITLVDRKKDMIITGGENVYPIEVEQVVFRHPAVREAAVFGLPDARWGETVVVAVALDADATPAEIIDHCRNRLAHYKCPTRVEIVDELPRNATGKILKRALRATYGPAATAVSR